MAASFSLLLFLLILLLLLLLLFRGEDTRRGFVSHLYKALRQKPINTFSSSSSSSSFSSSGLRWKYDVFINFRGEDSRWGFVSHLYSALVKKSINAFIDAEKLGKGDNLSELLTAVRESRLSLVIFSQNYASSTWCLNELVQILECKDTNNQIVIPIFYEVDPSDVRKVKGSFKEAFVQHDRDSNAKREEVQSWRSALTTASSLSGWDSQTYETEAVLIEKIVEDVYGKLTNISSTSSKYNGLVDIIEKIVEDVYRKLTKISSTSSKDNGLVDMDSHMHEMHEIACRFEACCFPKNVKKHGELDIQTQLLSNISDNKVGSSDISNKGFQVREYDAERDSSRSRSRGQSHSRGKSYNKVGSSDISNKGLQVKEYDAKRDSSRSRSRGRSHSKGRSYNKVSRIPCHHLHHHIIHLQRQIKQKR